MDNRSFRWITSIVVGRVLDTMRVRDEVPRLLDGQAVLTVSKTYMLVLVGPRILQWLIRSLRKSIRLGDHLFVG